MKRVETPTGQHPWLRLVTGAVLLAGIMAPRQAKAQTAHKANPVLAQKNVPCDAGHLRDCSAADLKTLIETGSDLTKANAAIVLARKEDVNDLRFLLTRLDIEAVKGAADAVSGLRNAVIQLADLDGAQEARTPMVMTLINVLKERDNAENPPANPRKMDEIVTYLTEAIQIVPAAIPHLTEELVISAEKDASAHAKTRLAGDLETLRLAVTAPNPNGPGAAVRNRQGPPGQSY